MWKYSALFSYLGTQYCGWQKQRRDLDSKQAKVLKPSIQETIEQTLLSITQEASSVVGSGRTDAGVHAIGQRAHFVLKKKPWDIRILQNAFNSRLPSDIQVISLQEVPLDFHAQKSAEKKRYSYYFQQGPCALPHLEPMSWWIRKELDLQKISEGLSYLVGQHDFKPFQASGAKPGPTVREIYQATVEFQPLSFPTPTRSLLGLVQIQIVGSGFLKQMIRGIAGTVLQIGEGRRDPKCIQEILESGNRKDVGPTAPARALWLERVWYPKRFQIDESYFP